MLCVIILHDLAVSMLSAKCSLKDLTRNKVIV